MGCGGRVVSQLSQRCGKEGMVRVIRGGQLAERLDCIGIGACGVLGAAEVAPATLRIVFSRIARKRLGIGFAGRPVMQIFPVRTYSYAAMLAVRLR